MNKLNKAEFSEPLLLAARPEDLEGLLNCYMRMYAELKIYGFPFELNVEQLGDVLKTYIESKLIYVLLLWDKGQVEGFITASISKLDRQFKHPQGSLVGGIKDIYVSDHLRNLALATKLYEQAEIWFTEKGVHFIQLNVFPGNQKAEAFWAKHGFLPMTTQMYKIIE